MDLRTNADRNIGRGVDKPPTPHPTPSGLLAQHSTQRNVICRARTGCPYRPQSCRPGRGRRSVASNTFVVEPRLLSQNAIRKDRGFSDSRLLLRLEACRGGYEQARPLRPKHERRGRPWRDLREKQWHYTKPQNSWLVFLSAHDLLLSCIKFAFPSVHFANLHV
jgi:hypothetical protein